MGRERERERESRDEGVEYIPRVEIWVKYIGESGAHRSSEDVTRVGDKEVRQVRPADTGRGHEFVTGRVEVPRLAARKVLLNKWGYEKIGRACLSVFSGARCQCITSLTQNLGSLWSSYCRTSSLQKP